MPVGPNGQKRPADTNSCAVMVARIVTGEIEPDVIMRRGWLAEFSRAEHMSGYRRSEIASNAARAHWSKG